MLFKKKKMDSTEEVTKEEECYYIELFDPKSREELKQIRALDEIVFHDSEEPPYEESIWKMFQGLVLFSKKKIIGYLMYHMRKSLEEFYDSLKA